MQADPSAPIQINPKDADSNITCAGALMCIMTRSCFNAVAGFDERFRGWGGENEAFAMSLDTICGPHYRMNNEIYHLGHRPINVWPEYSQNNFNLNLRYKKAMGNKAQMTKLIHERFYKIPDHPLYKRPTNVRPYQSIASVK